MDLVFIMGGFLCVLIGLKTGGIFSLISLILGLVLVIMANKYNGTL